MTRAELVAAEATRWRRLQHDWGRVDCVLVVADWVLRWTGRDPADGLRLTYRSYEGAERRTRFFTNPMGIMSERLDFLPRTERPRAGDVVLCQPVGGRAFAALCTGSLVVALSETEGVLHMRLRDVRLLAGWEVPCDL